MPLLQDSRINPIVDEVKSDFEDFPSKNFAKIRVLSALVHAFEYLPSHQMEFEVSQARQHELQHYEVSVVHAFVALFHRLI